LNATTFFYFIFCLPKREYLKYCEWFLYYNTHIMKIWHDDYILAQKTTSTVLFMDPISPAMEIPSVSCEAFFVYETLLLVFCVLGILFNDHKLFYLYGWICPKIKNWTNQNVIKKKPKLIFHLKTKSLLWTLKNKSTTIYSSQVRDSIVTKNQNFSSESSLTFFFIKIIPLFFFYSLKSVSRGKLFSHFIMTI